jgi:small GTP-binding protein
MELKGFRLVWKKVRNVSFSSIDNKFPLVKVNFWDVGGDDVYVEIRNEFYKDTSGAFLVFDVSNRSSFENLKKWRTEFMEFSSADEKVKFVLIGNKIDSDRIVGEDEGANLAKEWNAKYYETSALTGDNVEEMFVDLFYNSLAAKFEEYAEPLHGKEHEPAATENENDNASIHSEPSARTSVASIGDSAHPSASADH